MSISTGDRTPTIWRLKPDSAQDPLRANSARSGNMVDPTRRTHRHDLPVAVRRLRSTGNQGGKALRVDPVDLAEWISSNKPDAHARGARCGSERWVLMLFPSRKSMGKVVSFVTGGSICSRASASLRGGVGFAESGTPLRTDHLHRFVGLRALGIIPEATQQPVDPSPIRAAS